VDPVQKLVALAALDVAVERMGVLHPGAQLFVFGPEGDPFWAHYQPTHEELEVLGRAISVLQATEGRKAPLTIRGASGQFVGYVLDAERTLFAVALNKQQRRLPGEARVGRMKAPAVVETFKA
jgi:hypothetical protein